VIGGGSYRRVIWIGRPIIGLGLKNQEKKRPMFREINRKPLLGALDAGEARD